MIQSYASPFKLFDPNQEYVIAENNILPTYNGKNLLNVKPITQRIDFTGGLNVQNKITWSNNSIATIIHTMNCIPIIFVYNSNNQEVLPSIKIINATTIQIDFNQDVSNKEFYCIINYGTEYGNPTEISNTLTTYVQQAASAATQANNAMNVAQNAASTAVANTIQLDFTFNEDDELIMTRLGSTSFDFDVNNDGDLLFEITM